MTAAKTPATKTTTTRTRTAAKPTASVVEAKPTEAEIIPDPPQAKALPSYLTEWQVRELLKALDQWRIYENQGQVNVAQYDIRAHLTRIFGFGRWSGNVVAMELIFDRPWQLSSGKEGAYVAYRCGYQLTIRAMDGTELATYTEWSVGDDKKGLANHADAHAMAVKTAESQALKRAAINLGDQFGLSLYDKANVNLAKGHRPLPSLVQGTMLMPGQPWEAQQELEQPTTQVGEEVDPDHIEEFPARDVNQEPVPPQNVQPPQAPQEPADPSQAPPPTPTADSPQQQAPAPAEQVIYDGTEPVPLETDVPALIHEIEETIMLLEPERRTALSQAWKRTNLPPLKNLTTKQQIDKVWELYDQVKPAPMQQPGQAPVEDAAAAQLRQQQQAAARRHFPADVPADTGYPSDPYQ